MASIVVFELMLVALIIAVVLTLRLVLRFQVARQYKRFLRRVCALQRRYGAIKSISLRHVTSLESEGTQALKELNRITRGINLYLTEIDELLSKNSTLSLIVALDLLNECLSSERKLPTRSHFWRASRNNQLSHLEERFEDCVQIVGRRLLNSCAHLKTMGITPAMIGDDLFKKLQLAGVRASYLPDAVFLDKQRERGSSSSKRSQNEMKRLAA